MSTAAEDDDRDKTELTLNLHASDKDENAECFSEDFNDVKKLMTTEQNKVKKINR